MQSFSNCRLGWSKEPQWENNCVFLFCNIFAILGCVDFVDVLTNTKLTCGTQILNNLCWAYDIISKVKKKAKSNDVYVCVYVSFGFMVVYYCAGGVDHKFMEHK